MQAVVYQWNIKPGLEEEFQAAWHNVTLDLRERGGSLGSRLHRCEDGSFLAYALWPDLEAREAASREGIADQAAIAAMRNCIAERKPEMILRVLDDLLLPIPDDITPEAQRDIFAVLYHWIIRPDLEKPFEDIWHRVTIEIRAQYGVQGSRLHRRLDGGWSAYALWPSKAMRDEAFSRPVVTPQERDIMRAALVEDQIEVRMSVLDDLLLPT